METTFTYQQCKAIIHEGFFTYEYKHVIDVHRMMELVCSLSQCPGISCAERDYWGWVSYYDDNFGNWKLYWVVGDTASCIAPDLNDRFFEKAARMHAKVYAEITKKDGVYTFNVGRVCAG